MTETTYTNADMDDISDNQYFKILDDARRAAEAAASDARRKIELNFPAAEGWYWCVGVDGEMYLKEGS